MPEIVVAIPVRNEAALIGDCLRAIALPQGAGRADIVLLVNNSCDGTADLARVLQPTLPCRLHVIERTFPPDQANAGHARRAAMAHAATLADPGGVLLTTDADSSVSPDWLEANMAALAAGADAVCGRAVIDPVDALRIPTHLHEDDAREVAYGTLLDHITCLLSPDPADPWPRHTEESGASIAVRREVFLAAGGVPPVKLGEDRALVAALRRVDARIRHDPQVWVHVSGRTEGRAKDGMADTIRRRIVQQDPTIDESMEPVCDRIRRVGLRRRLRLLWQGVGQRHELMSGLTTALAVTREQVETWLALPCCGAALAAAEQAMPARRPVLRTQLAAQMEVARSILARLEADAALRTPPRAALSAEPPPESPAA